MLGVRCLDEHSWVRVMVRGRVRVRVKVRVRVRVRVLAIALPTAKDMVPLATETPGTGFGEHSQVALVGVECTLLQPSQHLRQS